MQTICVQGQGHFMTEPEAIILHARIDAIDTTYEKAKEKCTRKLERLAKYLERYSEFTEISLSESRLMAEPIRGFDSGVRCWTDVNILVDYNMRDCFSISDWISTVLFATVSSIEFVAQDAETLASDLYHTAFKDARRKASFICDQEGTVVGDVVQWYPHWNSNSELRISLKSFFLGNLDFTNVVSPWVPEISAVDFVFEVLRL